MRGFIWRAPIIANAALDLTHDNQLDAIFPQTGHGCQKTGDAFAGLDAMHWPIDTKRTPLRWPIRPRALL